MHVIKFKIERMGIRHLWRARAHTVPPTQLPRSSSENVDRRKQEMASLNMFLTATPIVIPQRRVTRTAATAAKATGGSSEEKGLLDFILGGLTKQDQFYETDPILKKVEEKSGGTPGSRKNSVVAPPSKKKDGGFGLGGLFAKK